MKIGYIGGFKDGSVESLNYQRHRPLNLDWIIEKEDPNKRMAALQNQLNRTFNQPINNDESIVYYNLMILRKDGEAKLFYVIDNSSKSDVEEGMAKHWENASTIGFDF